MSARPRDANPELELLFLRGLVDSPRECDAAYLEPHHLAVKAHQLVLKAIASLRHRDVVPSTGGIFAELQRMGATATVRDHDPELLLKLSSGVEREPALCAVELRKLAELRKARAAMREVDRLADAGNVDDALRAIEELGDAVGGGAAGMQAMPRYREATRAEWRGAARARRRITTGIPSLDDRIGGGLSVPSMTVVGADTGHGKSNLMLLMARAMAAAGVGVGVISLEDGFSDWMERDLALRTGVDYTRVRSRDVDLDERAMLEMAIDELPDQKLWILESIDAELDVVLDQMSALVAAGAEALFVDYIHALESPMLNMNRTDAVRTITRRLKAKAARLAVPLITGSQFNRPDKNDDEHKEPTRHRLKDSAAIAEKAEIILLIWQCTQEDRSGKLVPTTRVKLEKSKWSGPRWQRDLVRGAHGLLEVA